MIWPDSFQETVFRRPCYIAGATAVMLLLVNTCGALAQIQSVVQQTLGPCSPAIMNVQGDVTVNCIIIKFDDFVAFLKRYAEQGPEQSRQVAGKLAAPDEAYQKFLEAAKAYLAVVSAAK